MFLVLWTLACESLVVSETDSRNQCNSLEEKETCESLGFYVSVRFLRTTEKNVIIKLLNCSSMVRRFPNKCCYS